MVTVHWMVTILRMIPIPLQFLDKNRTCFSVSPQIIHDFLDSTWLHREVTDYMRFASKFQAFGWSKLNQTKIVGSKCPKTLFMEVLVIASWFIWKLECSLDNSIALQYLLTELLPCTELHHHNKQLKQAGAELCQARVKLEVIVEAELYLELKMKLATTILCDWVD